MLEGVEGSVSVRSETLRSSSEETSTEEAGSTRGRRGLVLRRAVMIASLVFVAVVAWQAWDEVASAVAVLRTVALGVMALALALQAFAVLTLPFVYRAALAALGSPLGFRQSLQVSMGAFTLSRVLPGGGAAGAVWAARRLQRFGVPLARAGTAVVLEGMLAMATLAVIVTAGTVAALLRGHVSGTAVAAAVAVAVAFFVGGWASVALLQSERVRTSVFSFAARLAPSASDRLRQWQDALADLRRELPGVRQLLPVVGWSAVNWLAEIAALWTVFAGLGIHMELGILVVGYGVANLVTALPHTPGGLGLVEAGMTGTYVALGTETSIALAGVLAYRLIAFWLPVLFGVPQYLRAPATSGHAS